MKDVTDMAADRGIFIDQSQSLNMFMTEVTVGKLTSMHFYSWKKGLKTGMYYLRTKAATDAIKFTVEKQAKEQLKPIIKTEQNNNVEEIACSITNPDDCDMCGS